MDVTLALQRAVRGFPHGTEALAARLRVSVTSLSHKVSPTYPGAHCSPEEVLEIMDITGDDGPLHALAQARGYVLLPAPRVAMEGDSAGLALAHSVQAFGEFAAESARGLADGRVTGNELARLQREAADALAAIQALVRLAQRVHEQSGPPGFLWAGA